MRLDSLQTPKPEAALWIWRSDRKLVCRRSNHVLGSEHSASRTDHAAGISETRDAGVRFIGHSLNDRHYELVDWDVGHCSRTTVAVRISTTVARRPSTTDGVVSSGDQPAGLNRRLVPPPCPSPAVAAQALDPGGPHGRRLPTAVILKAVI